MKTLTLLLLLTFQLATSTRAADELTSVLQQGLFNEEADHDLATAIKAYQFVVAGADAQRKLAATAVFRLGECYRKLGQTNEAVAQYVRILNDFTDQTNLMTLSRQNLAGLGASTERPRGKGMTGLGFNELLQLQAAQNQAGAKPEPAPAQIEAHRLLIERLELEVKSTEAKLARQKEAIRQNLVPQSSGEEIEARLLDLRRQLILAQDVGPTGAMDNVEATRALLQQLQALTRDELRRALPTVAPDPLLNSLLQQLAEAERRLASQRTALTDDNPVVKETREVLKAIHQQIDERIDGIMKGLSIKAAALKQKAGESGGGRVGGAVVADEEEQEIRRVEAIIRDSPDLINAVNVEVTRVRSGELMVPKNGTLLHKAASLGQLRVATFLLDHGADINARDQAWPQNTPLHWAANNGHRAMVELLLSRKADANARLHPDESTPLLMAARKSFRSVCETLLARGANPNLADAAGNTPLHEAAERGDEATLRLLLDKGAEVNRKDNAGSTPLHRATSTNTVRLLLERGAEVNAQNNEGRAPLHLAAAGGKAELVALLLEHKADVKLKNKNGATALHAAADAGAASVIPTLIRYGADPHQRASFGAVPLDLVIHSKSSAPPVGANYLETLKALMAGGADPNITGDRYVPALHRAAAEGEEEMVKLLLDHGANPNAQSDFVYGNRPGITPLINALIANKRSLAVARLLLAGKADPNLHEGDGNSPLFWAIGSGGQAFVDKAPFVDALLEHGANVEGKNSEGNTPLVWAIRWDMRDMVALLLKHNANPNVKSHEGQTPLHLAVLNNKRDLVDLLLAAGANPNATDANGLSALDYVKQRSQSPPQGSRIFRAVPSPAVIPGSPGTRADVSTSDLAEKLRLAGAKDWAPRPGQITVTRRSSGTTIVAFPKSTNNWNRHSLLEVMGFTFFGSGSSFPFPDFSKLTITRLDPASGGIKEFTVDLLAKLAAEDCKADLWLEWGDLIDIPEGEHKLDEAWKGLPSADILAFTKCLARKVTLIVKGQSKELSLQAGQWRTETVNGALRILPEWSFRVQETVVRSGMLLTSSDTTRVKVKRPDTATGRTQEWTFDLSKPIPAADDLWLRDSDVIEVPEK